MDITYYKIIYPVDFQVLGRRFSTVLVRKKVIMKGIISLVLPLLVTLLTTLSSGSPVFAVEEKRTGFQAFIPLVRELASHPSVIQAVKDQNASGLSYEEITRRDTEWKASKEVTPFKKSLMDNEAGRLFQLKMEENASVSEIFLTDNKGANVSAYPPTSDYWQGDESKWSDAYANGAGKMVISPFHYDKSANTVAAQISVPVESADAVIGVIIVGIKIKSYVKELAK